MTKLIIIIGGLLVACGTQDDGLTEVACWTEKGSKYLFWSIPEGLQVSEQTTQICEDIHESWQD